MKNEDWWERVQGTIYRQKYFQSGKGTGRKPAYRAAYGNKAPSYKQLTAHRNMTQRAKPPDHLDEETEAYWLAILDGGTSNVKKS